MEVNEAKEFLKSKGYYVDNLWHIEDVKDIRPNNLTDEQAYEILDKAMNNEYLMNETWETIDIIYNDLYKTIKTK
tara:strand:+ start:884 stop:1108 length:225 start_codon:yes stop_codon:yes gene_type:complete